MQPHSYWQELAHISAGRKALSPSLDMKGHLANTAAIACFSCQQPFHRSSREQRFVTVEPRTNLSKHQPILEFNTSQVTHMMCLIVLTCRCCLTAC